MLNEIYLRLSMKNAISLTDKYYREVLFSQNNFRRKNNPCKPKIIPGKRTIMHGVPENIITLTRQEFI